MDCVSRKFVCKIRKWGSDECELAFDDDVDVAYAMGCCVQGYYYRGDAFLMEKLYALHECQPVVTEGGVLLPTPWRSLVSVMNQKSFMG